VEGKGEKHTSNVEKVYEVGGKKEGLALPSVNRRKENRPSAPEREEEGTPRLLPVRGGRGSSPKGSQKRNLLGKKLEREREKEKGNGGRYFSRARERRKKSFMLGQGRSRTKGEEAGLGTLPFFRTKEKERSELLTKAFRRERRGEAPSSSGRGGRGGRKKGGGGYS